VIEAQVSAPPLRRRTYQRVLSWTRQAIARNQQYRPPSPSRDEKGSPSIDWRLWPDAREGGWSGVDISARLDKEA
jgi:hypothetical protein